MYGVLDVNLASLHPKATCASQKKTVFRLNLQPEGRDKRGKGNTSALRSPSP